ncbi:MAG: aminopeptidase [Deltaproteobacteria bacterium]|nr:aminopeptidase [Deltaproteobacteria bacterium]MBW2015327.1 aminopeptidase [Deltaproteobacteria bacterium]MBW2128188.1 aminopeptidase [Deltaproteobacteria bacterium]
MLTDYRLEKYSEVLMWGLTSARKGRYKKGDIVLIRYDRPATRLAEILLEKIMQRGMHPVLRAGLTPTMEHSFFQIANTSQLVFQTPGEKELYSNLHGSIYLYAPESLTHLRDIDPKKIGRATIARKPLRDILDKREEEGHFGWTLCIVPTEELAKQSGLSLKQYDQQVIRACYLDRSDPVAEWREIFKKANKIKQKLSKMNIDYLHVESESMDLKITPGKDRKWVGISGHNIPSFEIFLSPDWRGTEGIYYADQPSFRSGNYVEGVRLTFKKGEVVKVEARKGRNFILAQLAIDKGARRVGEFSLTDRRFSRINRFMANTLFDENFGGRQGNCHLALGASYSDTFSGNPDALTKEKKEALGFNDSALHWDLVNTEKKRVTAYLADGEQVVIYENGMFQLGI